MALGFIVNLAYLFQLYLPNCPSPCGGIRATEGDLANLWVFKRGDVTLPDIEVDQVDTRGPGQGRVE
jgi:hypothetical protein